MSIDYYKTHTLPTTPSVVKVPKITLSAQQQQDICACLESATVREWCAGQAWYAQFRAGIVYDIQHQGQVTARQLDQIEKICRLSGVEWPYINPRRTDDGTSTTR